jgi:hypothetical protein
MGSPAVAPLHDDPDAFVVSTLQTVQLETSLGPPSSEEHGTLWQIPGWSCFGPAFTHALPTDVL